MNLHIVRNGVVHDSRVLRETKTLSDSGLFDSLEIAGFEQAGLPEREDLAGRGVWRVPIDSRKLPKDLVSQSVKYAEWRHRVVSSYRQTTLSVIHCHDLEPLPIAVKLKQLTGAKLIYDAHELETERAHIGLLRRPFARSAEERCMKYVDGMITVSPSIQQWYQEKFPAVPISLVRNVPERVCGNLVRVDLRGKLGVPEASLLFIFQGGHGRGRSIEVLLDAFSHPLVEHHVLFMGDGAFAEKVRAAAAAHVNIHWLPPVPPDLLLATTAGADVGLSLIEDISLSYRYCLPNKLFEYWLAGIPVLASMLPDQAALIERYKAGWLVTPNLSELVAKLRSLCRYDVIDMEAGLKRVRSELSWENEAEELLALYHLVLGRSLGRAVN